MITAKIPPFGEVTCELAGAAVNPIRREIRLSFTVDSIMLTGLDVICDLYGAKALREKLDKGIKALEVER